MLVQWRPLHPPPTYCSRGLGVTLILRPFPISHTIFSKFKYNFTSNVSFKCLSSKKCNTHEASSLGFSVLSSDIPWDSGSLWSTMAFYMFSLHIPLSFGGLSAVSQLLHQPVLDSQTEAVSLLIIQTVELIGTLVLLRWTAKSQAKLANFVKSKEFSKERNWLWAAVLGFGFLILTIFLTSILADRFFGPKAVNNPILKEILLSSDISKTACALVYCVLTPLLEETVYRGFLLTSLSSTMKWQQATIISSAIFSAAHFSGENSIQLFVIGCVLGCCYCWTGNLCSSIAVHSLYNALTLIITFLS